MSHLTDGELHLLLDGAQDLLPEDRAGEIRDHLSSCGDCRARLDEEREIRDRSMALLGDAAPVRKDIPPFQDLLAQLRLRAGAAPAAGSTLSPEGAASEDAAPESAVPDARTGGAATEEARGTGRRTGAGSFRPASWAKGLTWAATVVLSLGIGWYAGGGDGEPGPAEEIDRAAESSGEARAPRGPARTPDEPVGAPSEPAGNPAEGAGAAVERPEARRAEERQRATPSPLADAAPPVGGAASVERSLALPGLPVLSVAWEGDTVGGAPALTLLQRLPSGDTLQLRYAYAADGSGNAEREAEPAAFDRAAPRMPSATAEPPAARAPESRADRAAAGSVALDTATAETAEDPAATEDTAPPSEETASAPGSAAPGSASPTVVERRGPWLLEVRGPLTADSVRALLEGMPPP